MKIRWTSRSVRVRIDDLEVAALLRGERLDARLEWPGGGWPGGGWPGGGWPGGGWSMVLDPTADGVQGEGGLLRIGLASELSRLADPNTEGVRLPGPPRVDVEKDYRPAHLS